MQMGYGLWQEQTQKLVMTPELRQAITVLQFSSEELAGYLEAEAVQNPVMELELPDWLAASREHALHKPIGAQRETNPLPVESVLRSHQSLEDHLNRQLQLLKLSERELRLASFIVGSLDSNGYLTMQIDEISHICRCDAEEVEAALQIVQSLEPTGVGARSLSECLWLQALEIKNVPEPVFQIIENHLPDVAQGRTSRIAAVLGITLQETQRAIDLIRSLDPKPGRWYTTESAAFVVPDVIVERVAGDYVVIVNDRSTPRLHISDFYRTLLQQQDGSVPSETRDYIVSKLNSALWLLKSMEQRRQTLYKVTEAIISLQMDFFDGGVAKLKPLTLRDVAERVGIHESTVSRAIAGKYVQTPQGVYELKYFFDSGVTTSAGEGAAAESVKSLIKSLVDKEDRKEPLSDQKICEILKEKGIRISRRTVAKYREEIGIVSSMQRKRY
ncbi:RNA polymerase factor sigma-54 [Effusibacillus dendaii]|uniref:RNA polymerase sigma-54 factor n=1 Tax=Effusibacillus dendaii TaxID=2743772 RepID=A0A7I8DAD5_9BACL|nr:RNA polymerase factor sigma-54 [Effusibacillus dendaii]BCJ86947.1 RNA polymerase sigma-54 factor [Effusibacillus dendaii]